MRGKVPISIFCRFCAGITPAYAGKSWLCWFNGGNTQDHPRVCGEMCVGSGGQCGAAGSPPRMRGKELSFRKALCLPGITPAYAGKRAGGRMRQNVSEDHPRVCGEKRLAPLVRGGGWGSPPRMRGKERCVEREPLPQRITPAYAGKRLKRSRSTVPPVAIVPLFPSVCNKPVVSGGSPAGRDAPLFLPAENAVPASPAYNLRSL